MTIESSTVSKSTESYKKIIEGFLTQANKSTLDELLTVILDDTKPEILEAALKCAKTRGRPEPRMLSISQNPGRHLPGPFANISKIAKAFYEYDKQARAIVHSLFKEKTMIPEAVVDIINAYNKSL